MGRIIDSLLRVDGDGVPIIPGTTISGVIAQGMFDLLRFKYFEELLNRVCPFHRALEKSPRMPCALTKPSGEQHCLLCYFFGSSAEEGLVLWEDFHCISDPGFLRPLFESSAHTPDERKQYIKSYVSHRQDMRTKTVMPKHLFVHEEGAPLVFEGKLTFRETLDFKRAAFLAAAIKNVRSIGRRKTRGKGSCDLDGMFHGDTGVRLADLVEKI
jgi:hypothetical protein